MGFESSKLRLRTPAFFSRSHYRFAHAWEEAMANKHGLQ